MLSMYYIMCPAFFGSIGAALLAASFDYIAVIADASIAPIIPGDDHHWQGSIPTTIASYKYVSSGFEIRPVTLISIPAL